MSTQAHEHSDESQPSTPRGEGLRERASGVLLHLTALPSAHGVGDLGAAAYAFVDALAAAGQRYWQLLPVNPTLGIAGDSPYFSSSALAGNPLLIDLEALVEDGLLLREELRPERVEGLREREERVNFDAVRAFKLPLLDLAQKRFRERGYSAEFAAFLVAHADWLSDHALFVALGAHHGGDWASWPDPLRRRDPAALRSAIDEHAEAIASEQVLQYLFSRQWQKLRAYANSRHVELFGDMPIYVAYDSVDVWANPRVFQLDEDLRPLQVSGVPPDYFSATGQLWNNPVYAWDFLQATDFAWWQRRIANNLEHYDLLRIDHFRGLVQYWAVPAGSETAIDGQWFDVPTAALFSSLERALGTLPVVVEDLGTITDDVVAARDDLGFPGMVVLHFAFGSDDPHNPHRLENHAENAVAYLGTHDNDTSAGWLAQEVDAVARQRLASRLADDWEQEPVFSLIRMLQESPARLAIVTAQDLLELSSAARMNDPSQPGDNWHWRMSHEQFEALPLGRLRAISEATGRLGSRVGEGRAER